MSGITYFIFGIRKGQFGIIKKPVLLLQGGEKREKNNVALSLHNTSVRKKLQKENATSFILFAGGKKKKFRFALAEAS